MTANIAPIRPIIVVNSSLMVLNGLFVVGQDTRVFPPRASMSALPNSIFDALYHSSDRNSKLVDAMAGRHL